MYKAEMLPVQTQRLLARVIIQEESHSGGKVVEIYTTAILLFTLMPQWWQLPSVFCTVTEIPRHFRSFAKLYNFNWTVYKFTLQQDNVQETDDLKKLVGQKIVSCRICKGDHWTTKCPYKDQLENIQQQLEAEEGNKCILCTV